MTEKDILKLVEETFSEEIYFINLQFEVVEYDNIEKGDFFIDGDTIHCCSRVNGDVVIDTKGLWHNPNSIKKVVGQKLIK